jgi:rfaE bifunctional protein nucleotidyltransferase chain/domain
LARKPPYEEKVYVPASGIKLADWVSELAHPLVFTNGCFDILHRGHVSYLQQAARLGASLVVGVNSDNSVKRLGKDPLKPINSLEDRMAMVAALESVDAVISFDEDTPLDLILAVRPDVLVKGGDWPIDQIVGGAEVAGWGGSVHSIEFEFERSTTSLIEKIRG